jgi:outer membrane receptor for Fe3+-dicitrate
MSDKSSDSAPPRISPSIYLDYGVDKHDCSNQGFEICERGMRFNSHWQFSLGTQLAVSFAYQDDSGGTRRVTTEGIIVDCEQIACKCYYSTLLFLELPESLREVVKNADLRLEASVANKGETKMIPHKAGLN